MDDVPQLKALDIYLEASEDVTSHAHQRLAEKALSRVCKGPILGIPAEDLQEMSAPAWLKIVSCPGCALSGRRTILGSRLFFSLAR